MTGDVQFQTAYILTVGYSAQDFEALPDGAVTPFSFSVSVGDVMLYYAALMDP